MKDRKFLQHGELISEVTKQLATRFKPSPPAIKQAVERLIEKEYLERDDQDRRKLKYLVSLSIGRRDASPTRLSSPFSLYKLTTLSAPVGVIGGLDISCACVSFYSPLHLHFQRVTCSTLHAQTKFILCSDKVYSLLKRDTLIRKCFTNLQSLPPGRGGLGAPHRIIGGNAFGQLSTEPQPLQLLSTHDIRNFLRPISPKVLAERVE